MNKKVNTLLFILAATLFNIIIAVASFILLLLFYAKFINPIVPDGGLSWAFPLIFIASIAISIFVYRAVLKYFLTKVDMEKLFDPIFVKKNLRKPGSTPK
ncbi:MAG: leader peptide processing enzyme [Treponema sp.]|nr:leader peptide processing enzyme [Treponema sp.]